VRNARANAFPAQDASPGVVQIFANAIFCATLFIALERGAIQYFANAAQLCEGAPFGSLSSNGALASDRRAACLGRHGALPLRPSFSNQELGFGFRQIEKITLPVRRHVYPVEPGRELTDETDTHDKQTN
jgi:hypothetical protein